MDNSLKMATHSLPTPPRFILGADGAVDFDDASYYHKNFSPSTSDSNHFTLAAWVVPNLNDAAVYGEFSFAFAAGKTVGRRRGLQFLQRGTEQMRVTAQTVASASNLQLDLPPVLDMGEYNMIAVSGDNSDAVQANRIYTWVHWSATSGLSFGTAVPSKDLGAPLEFSRATDAAMGAAKPVTGSWGSLLGGDLAQFFMNDVFNDFRIQSTRERIISESPYKSFLNLGPALMHHSGDTGAFATNHGSLYATADVNDVALSDATAPVPPFTL